MENMNTAWEPKTKGFRANFFWKSNSFSCIYFFLQSTARRDKLFVLTVMKVRVIIKKRWEERMEMEDWWMEIGRRWAGGWRDGHEGGSDGTVNWFGTSRRSVYRSKPLSILPSQTIHLHLWWSPGKRKEQEKKAKQKKKIFKYGDMATAESWQTSGFVQRLWVYTLSPPPLWWCKIQNII